MRSPKPIEAGIHPSFAFVDVNFDLDVTETVADPSLWFVRANDESYQILAVVSPPGLFIRLSVQAPTPNLGPNVVSYSPPPFDIQRFRAPFTKVVGFQNFPLIVPP